MKHGTACGTDRRAAPHEPTPIRTDRVHHTKNQRSNPPMKKILFIAALAGAAFFIYKKKAA